MKVISMHTDGQPFGSSIFGYEGSSPKLLRVIYYFDDLTKEINDLDNQVSEIKGVISRLNGKH